MLSSVWSQPTELKTIGCKIGQKPGERAPEGSKRSKPGKTVKEKRAFEVVFLRVKREARIGFYLRLIGELLELTVL